MDSIFEIDGNIFTPRIQSIIHAIMRKIFWIAIVFLTVGFIFFSFSELQSITEILRQANLGILLAAIFVQLFWVYNLGLTFQSIYWLMGLKENSFYLAKLAAATNFVNVVAPTLGLGGMALFVNYGKKRGYPGGKVTATTAIFLLLDHGSFIAILLLGIIVLIRRNNLSTGEIGAASFLLLVFSVFFSLILIGMRSAKKLEAVLRYLTRLVNRITAPFIHRPYINEARATHFANEVAEGLINIRRYPKRLLKPIFFSLLNKSLLVFVVLMMFTAFKVPFSAGTIIGGFSIGYLFQLVSITPSGVGFMESAFTLGLKSLGVNWGHAVIITLSYRAITLWFPLGLGAIAFRSIEKESKKENL